MKNTSYKSEVLQNKESQMELFWWVKNIEIYNGRTLIQLSPQALLQTDTSLTGWGDSLGRSENWRDKGSAGEKDAHKRTGTSCITTSPGNLFESTGNRVTAYSDGQYSGPDLLSENGEAQKIYKWFIFPNKFGNCY